MATKNIETLEDWMNAHPTATGWIVLMGLISSLMIVGWLE